MHEAYTKLMLQQNLSVEADAAFYEKLENTQPKKRMQPTLRAAAIAACILLLIPVTVLAVESIFGVIKVTQCERPTYDDKPGVGLDIQYENIKDYAIKDFPKHLQELEEGEVIYHESWTDAEEYLGIDLLANSLFTDADTRQRPQYFDSWNGPRKHCQGIYRVMDGQFYSASIQAAFHRSGVSFDVAATVTADHPTVNKEDILKYYHGNCITYLDRHGTQIDTEQYTTQAGIPVLIVTVSRNSLNVYNIGADILDCNAYFAVNDISYEVCISGWSFGTNDLDTYASPKEKIMATMIEVLEGFTLE